MPPGGTLVLRGGTCVERVKNPVLQPAAAEARTRVLPYPGERPVLQGLLWLKGAQYWDFSGLNVTWDSATGQPNEHMVKLTDGKGWTFTGAEVWGAHSYAGVLVAGAASDWRLSHNYVHDTVPTNGTNQDHLVYVNTTAPGGVVERNVLAHSRNGRAVKVGPPAADSGRVAGVAIRYNTMVDNRGPSSVQLAWGTSDVQVDHT